MDIVLLKLGRAMLFLLFGVVVALGLEVGMLIFLGAIMLPWADIMKYDMPYILAPYVITFAIAVAAGSYTALMVVYRHNKIEGDKWANRIMNTVMWMFLTIWNMFVMSFMLILAWSIAFYDMKADFVSIIPEVRYLLIIAVVFAGWRAWRLLSREPESS